jgi:hypothetical protein
VSNSLPVTTNIKMIEVFMLTCLILCFLDILLQTYVHYIKKEKPTKKEGEDEDEEEEEDDFDEPRMTFVDLIRYLAGNKKDKGKVESKEPLTKEQIFELTMMTPQSPTPQLKNNEAK